MKLAVFSHCAVDSITIRDDTYEQVGGAACYCGLTAREFGFDVDLFTRFGSDFPRQYIEDRRINIVNPGSRLDTTRFDITVDGADRTMRLGNECEPIDYAPSDADGHLVSPIYHEVSPGLLSRIKRDSGFVFVDPQGFLRDVDQSGNIVLKESGIDLTGVDAIKVDPSEARCLAGGSNDEMMVAIQKRGAKHVLLTDKTDISLLVKDKVYSITLPNKEVYDTTGLGDIFCAVFCCTMLKEKDFLWALCFAGGAVQAALDSKNLGLQKIPRRGQTQTNASYFYNLLRFRDL